ncbi:M23 family metallopeptidase [Nonomuraea longispora]|uniref:M23 family metallopeptidase n=1 Tax=Nonomuraea longispora TaxID=1848320 RepID=A0A4R4MHA9_9ACTN|nr:M23 family metallopeptidase [Nonomuraea longispora]TDB95057.1 M23 family metallopeptidase [Nonomuraea longispora]
MVVTTALIAALGVFGAASPAMAAPDLQLPFPCGQKWQLNTWAHAPALDMVKEPDQRGTEGATLIAPAAGRVNQSFYHDNAGNMVQIDHGGGYFTTYIHLQSRAVSKGDRVQRGTVIGKVGKTGPTSNGHPHLHFELGYDSNGDGSASWGYKGSERVKPMINGVTYGQANGREWNNVESHNCPEPAPEGVASVYGVTPEGRLTYTAIDAATGRRTHGAVHSTAGLGFTPKAMATLNFNTLLVTEDKDPGGKLYRVDIRTNRDTPHLRPTRLPRQRLHPRPPRLRRQEPPVRHRQRNPPPLHHHRQQTHQNLHHRQHRHRRRLHPQNPHHHRTRLAPRHHHSRRTHLLPDPRRRQLETPPTTRHHLAGLRPPSVPRRRRLLRPPPRQLHAQLPRQGPPRRPRRRPQQTDHRRHQRLEPDPPVSPTRHRDLRAHGPGG